MMFFVMSVIAGIIASFAIIYAVILLTRNMSESSMVLAAIAMVGGMLVTCTMLDNRFYYPALPDG